LTQTPIYAVWASVALSIAINLIGLGSYAAIAGVFNVTAIALDWSYVIPILCKLVYGKFEPGPWHMGKAGFWVNAWACIWTMFVTIIFILPAVRPVTALNVRPSTQSVRTNQDCPTDICLQMNYAIAFLGLIFVFASVYWVISGRKFYTGPIVETEIAGNTSQDMGDGSSEEQSREILEK
jgi:predicted neutral ceramidase superfamily lipid hydrolase